MATSETQSNKEEQESTPGVVQDYSITEQKLRISTPDGSRFTVDRHTMAIFSPIFKTMFEDVSDNSESLMVVDAGFAWKTVLDVIHNHSDLPTLALDEVEAALEICKKYEMDLVKSFLVRNVV